MTIQEPFTSPSDLRNNAQPNLASFTTPHNMPHDHCCQIIGLSASYLLVSKSQLPLFNHFNINYTWRQFLGSWRQFLRSEFRKRKEAVSDDLATLCMILPACLRCSSYLHFPRQISFHNRFFQGTLRRVMRHAPSCPVLLTWTLDSPAGIIRHFCFSYQLLLKVKRGGQSGCNGRFLRFIVQSKGWSTTRVIEVQLDMPTSPLKASSILCYWVRMCLKMSIPLGSWYWVRADLPPGDVMLLLNMAISPLKALLILCY